MLHVLFSLTLPKFVLDFSDLNHHQIIVIKEKPNRNGVRWMCFECYKSIFIQSIVCNRIPTSAAHFARSRFRLQLATFWVSSNAICSIAAILSSLWVFFLDFKKSLDCALNDRAAYFSNRGLIGTNARILVKVNITKTNEINSCLPFIRANWWNQWKRVKRAT